jgi:hypothetical protein
MLPALKQLTSATAADRPQRLVQLATGAHLLKFVKRRMFVNVSDNNEPA